MKMKNLFKLFAAVCLVTFAACSGEEPVVGPGVGQGQGGDTTTTTTGDGTRQNPFTVNDVIAKANAAVGPYWVKGYIVGQVPGKALAETEFAEIFVNKLFDKYYKDLKTYNIIIIFI